MLCEKVLCSEPCRAIDQGARRCCDTLVTAVKLHAGTAVNEAAGIQRYNYDHVSFKNCSYFHVVSRRADKISKCQCDRTYIETRNSILLMILRVKSDHSQGA
jgi:hypothetical protein